MYWITFIASGFIVASIPWVASHFSNRVAGYVILIPIILILSLSTQHITNGHKATAEMLTVSVLGIPALIIFILSAQIMSKNGVSLPVIVMVSLLAWLISVFAIDLLTTKYL